MAVALNDLRGHRCRLEAQPRADLLFVLRCQVAKGSHGAGELAHAHILGGRVETGQIPLDLGKPVEQFEAESGWLCMDAVSVADSGRVLEFHGPPPEYSKKFYKPRANQRRGFFHLQRLRSIHHVVRGQPVMQPARLIGEILRAQALGHSGGEGDNVMLHLSFNLLNALDGEAGFCGNGLGGSLGNHAALGQHEACRRLYLKPAAVLVLFGPDASHRQASIAFNQDRLLARTTFRGPCSTLDSTGYKPSGARNTQSFVQLIDQQAAARLVWLEPFAIDHQLRNGPLAHATHHLSRGGRLTVHIDLDVLDAMRIEKLSGCPAIPAPGNPIHLHDHGIVLLGFSLLLSAITFRANYRRSRKKLRSNSADSSARIPCSTCIW